MTDFPPALATHVFFTQLGWMALAARYAVLLELSFGHENPRSAISCLRCGEGPLDQSASSTQKFVHKLADRLTAYAAGGHDDFLDIDVDDSDATPFQRRVGELCRRIPYGDTCTYGELARRAGAPRAARAVGNCMRANRTPLIVPCHRVVGAGGGLVGYSAAEGTRMKLRLLEMESVKSRGSLASA